MKSESTLPTGNRLLFALYMLSTYGENPDPTDPGGTTCPMRDAARAYLDAAEKRHAELIDTKAKRKERRR